MSGVVYHVYLCVCLCGMYMSICVCLRWVYVCLCMSLCDPHFPILVLVTAYQALFAACPLGSNISLFLCSLPRMPRT